MEKKNLPQRSKEEKAKYMKEYRAKNREKLLASSKAYYYDNIEKCKAHSNKMNKKPEAKERRRLALRKWRKKNLKRSTFHSYTYYIRNKAKCDLDHRNWEKERREKFGSSWTRYKKDKYSAVAQALARTRGTKYESGDDKITKKDIVVLKAEIKRLRAENDIS